MMFSHRISIRTLLEPKTSDDDEMAAEIPIQSQESLCERDPDSTDTQNAPITVKYVDSTFFLRVNPGKLSVGL